MSTLQGSPALAIPSRRPRINLRLVLLLAVVALPFIYFGYVIVDQAITGGVKDRGGYYEVDLKSLGQFPFDPAQDDTSNVPEKWRQLDGKKVMLVGEMYAGTSAAPKVPAFQLVYSIQKCCFGGPPRVQERVFVKAPPNDPAPFYWQPVRVTGTLHVNARRVEGQVISVFDMDVDRVEPVG
jgi:hypothetical protein